MTITTPAVVQINVVYNLVFIVDAQGNRIAAMIGTAHEKRSNAELICCALNGPEEIDDDCDDIRKAVEREDERLSEKAEAELP